MSETTTEQATPERLAKIRARIEQYLAKANATQHDEEAQAFSAEAARLMLKYGILAAELDAESGHRKPDDIVRVTIELLTGRWGKIHFQFAGSVLQYGLQNVKVLQHHRTAGRKVVQRFMWVVGYESDVNDALTLYASLLQQAQTALTRWLDTDEGWRATAWLPPSTSWAVKRDFVLAFGRAASDKIQANRQQVVEEAGTGVELALRNRSDAIDESLNDLGKLTSVKGSAMASAAAALAGRAAGAMARTGEVELPASRELTAQ